MSQSPPLISIGMSVFNNEATVAQAIQSLVDQTCPDWELLLFDDGSTDDTLRVVQRFRDDRIKVLVDGENRGLPARMNQAIDMSRGRYFARMDGDDIAFPERFERQLAYLDRHRDVDLVGAHAIVFSSDGRAFGARRTPECHEAICAHPPSGFPMMHPTFVGKIEFFRRHYYCPAVGSLCDDMEFLLRAYPTSRFANLQEILLGYRQERQRLYFRKQLRTRWCLARNFFRVLRGRSEFQGAAASVAVQSFKLMADSLAIATGLHHRLLRHRARPVTPAEHERWQFVWSNITERQFCEDPCHG